MNYKACSLLFCLAALAPEGASAAMITLIQLTNNGSPDAALATDTRIREFRTQSTAPSSATTTATTSSFSTRMAWMSGHRVSPGNPFQVLSFSNTVAYDVAFRVEDPLNAGYNLNIDSIFRGYLTAQADGTDNSSFSPLAFAAGTLMTASLDSGGGFLIVPSLATDIEVAVSNSATPFENVLASRLGSYNAGSFTGTRDFILRFSSSVANANASLGNFSFGESNVRFGLDPLTVGFLNATYPGVDLESPDSHGHFLNITATFDAAANPVPEADSLTLALTGVVLIMIRTLLSRCKRSDSSTRL